MALTAADKRQIAIVKLGLAEIAMCKAREALLHDRPLQEAQDNLQLGAMRGEEAAKLLDELKGTQS